jgi:hypothetical protein
VIGVSDASRAQAASASLGALSAGAAPVLTIFAQQLDRALVAAGKPAATLDVSSVTFAEPTQTQGAETAAKFGARFGGVWTTHSQQQGSSSGWAYSAASSSTKADVNASKTKTDSSSTLLLVLCVVAAACLLFVLAFRNKSSTTAEQKADAADFTGTYAAKVEAAGVQMQ